jgi:uncharacterized protein YjcR
MEKSRQFLADGEKHRVFKSGNRVLVDHTDKHGGKWDVIDLTKESGAKTVSDGVKAVKKYHNNKES